MNEGSDSALFVVNPPHLDAYGHLMRRRNRHCIITIGAAPHPRKFYWRYKAGLQRAVRDGDWKYLRIAGNEFLFGVVQDPRERANLKDRHRDVFGSTEKRLGSMECTMLPERPRQANYGQPGNLLADHYGVATPPPQAPPANTTQR